MVILPTEKRFDWKYAPVMLFTLVILNVLIFFLYQSEDGDKFQLALDYYYNSDLIDNEWPAYQTYLDEQGKKVQLSALREKFKRGYNEAIIVAIVADRDFYQYLDQNSDELVFETDDQFDSWDSWHADRDKVNNYIESMSALQAGLIPADMGFFSFVSYQFLHGSFMHLLGNMIFLVFCGFAVEAAIGPWMFLGLYIASGIVGGLFFSLLDMQSTRPLVGASGAISGVMAMYLGIFRLRKIEFFYWIFIFAGYFRAPALLILPFYIGNELLDYLQTPDSNVAFMAHAGGFVSGAVLVAILYKLKPGIFNHEYIEENQDADPEREARAKIYGYMDQMKFDKAVDAIAKYNDEFGADFDLIALSYQLSHATRHTRTAKLLNKLLSMKPHDQQQVGHLAKAYKDNPDLLEKIDPKMALNLAMNLSIPEYIPLAEKIFSHYYNPNQTQNQNNKSLAVLARKLAYNFEKLQQADKRKYYEGIADGFLGGTI